MNWIDFILLVPVLYGLIRGLMRGAVLEIASFLGIIIALFVARLYAPVVSYHFESWLDVSDKSAQIIAFGTVFLVTLILIQILARLIDKFLSALSRPTLKPPTPAKSSMILTSCIFFKKKFSKVGRICFRSKFI